MGLKSWRMTDLFNHVVCTWFPPTWSHHTIYLVHKSGSSMDPNNCRMIMHLSTGMHSLHFPYPRDEGLCFAISSLYFYPFLIFVFLFVMQDGIIKNYFPFICLDLEKHYVFPYFKYGKSLLNLCMHFFLIDVICIML